MAQAAKPSLKRSSLVPPSQAKMDALVQSSRAEVGDLVNALTAKLIDPAEFVDRIAEHLQDAHTKAVVLGRQRAGDLTAQEDDDATYAAQVVDGQAEFLDKFRQALDDGDSRYVDEDGGYRSEAILNRAEMYSQRLLGTANEAFLLTSDKALASWVLGDDDNCVDCVVLAESSPKPADEWETVPLAGGTVCLLNCKCSLRRADGVEGFQPTAS